jgi:hypothetical protein
MAWSEGVYVEGWKYGWKLKNTKQNKKGLEFSSKPLFLLAPRVGLEPTA